MKVLLVGLGSRGDVQPQVVLAEELKRRGHEVTLGAPPDFAAWITERGLRYVAIGEAIEPFLARNREMTERHPALALPGQIRVTREYTRRAARDLKDANLTADVVLGAGLSFAGKSLADKLGVPHVFCCYSASAVYSPEYPPAVLPVFGLPRLGNQALWLGLRLTLDVALGGVLNEARRELGLSAHRGSWMKLLAGETLLAQDGVLGEAASHRDGRVTQIPALIPRLEQARPLSDSLERFLRGAGDGSADASPVVYLGFGSMPSVDQRATVQIARELFEQHGVRVVLYSPADAHAAAELPAGVFLTGDTDHQSLFPRVDLIVHHGGAGTTAAALRSGVPQLVVPHIVDQFFHGRRIAELGVGPAPVAKNSLTVAAIAAALKNRFKYWGAAQSARAKVVAEGGARLAADYLERLVSAPGGGAR